MLFSLQNNIDWNRVKWVRETHLSFFLANRFLFIEFSSSICLFGPMFNNIFHRKKNSVTKNTCTHTQVKIIQKSYTFFLLVGWLEQIDYLDYYHVTLYDIQPIESICYWHHNWKHRMACIHEKKNFIFFLPPIDSDFWTRKKDKRLS